MEAGRGLFCGGGGDSNFNTVFLQTQRLPYQSSKEPLLTPGLSPSFHGSSSMVSFCDVKGGFFRTFDQDESECDNYDEYFNQPEKKRRLTADQVQFLEKSFEVENKLEPERKVQLAKELGLQPRQIAIWFQNRRARWKTKQLEKDYDGLKARYDDLKAKYDSLLREKDYLKAEVLRFMDKLLLEGKEKETLKSCDHIQQPSEALSKEHMADSVPEDGMLKASVMTVKQEDTSLTKSDVLDSDSPRYTDGVQSSFPEIGDSSHAFFEPDRSESDLSHEEDDSFNKNFMPPESLFPKVKEDHYPIPSGNSYFFGFPVEDQTFGFWAY